MQLPKVVQIPYLCGMHLYYQSPNLKTFSHVSEKQKLREAKKCKTLADLTPPQALTSEDSPVVCC